MNAIFRGGGQRLISVELEAYKARDGTPKNDSAESFAERKFWTPKEILGNSGHPHYMAMKSLYGCMLPVGVPLKCAAMADFSQFAHGENR
jgi:hypothetical protein